VGEEHDARGRAARREPDVSHVGEQLGEGRRHGVEEPLRMLRYREVEREHAARSEATTARLEELTGHEVGRDVHAAEDVDHDRVEGLLASREGTRASPTATVRCRIESSPR
jgi:hypothetical protein